MEQIVVSIALGYISVMSIIGFTMMGIDKKRAIKKAWRIPERTLILVAFLGGGIGSFIGMYTFRHKTKHSKFVILIPTSAVLYIAIGVKFLKLLGLI